MPPLTDEERAKLQSCIEEIHNVIGEAPVSERQLVETVLKNKFDFTKSLDEILNDLSRKPEPEVKSKEKKESMEKGEYFHSLNGFKLTNQLHNWFFSISFHVG